MTIFQNWAFGGCGGWSGGEGGGGGVGVGQSFQEQGCL